MNPNSQTQPDADRTETARRRYNRVAKTYDFSQGLLESSGLTQSTGLIPPSVIRTIPPTVISSGFLLKKYPPEGPLLLPMIPPFFSFWNICSIYLGEIPSRLEMSLTCVSNPSE